MRDILFRGKSIDSGKWLYGYPLIDMAECSLKAKGKCVCPHDGSSAEILFWNDAFHKYDSESVIPDTIGQYTGLTDKNGVKIFEGDFVHHDYDWPGKLHEVIFEQRNGNAYFGWVCFGRAGPAQDTLPFTGRYLRRLEVIGNIHDNPKLQDGEDDREDNL